MEINVEVKQKILNGVPGEKKYTVIFIRKYEFNGLFTPSDDRDMIHELDADGVRQLATELPDKLLKALEI